MATVLLLAALVLPIVLFWLLKSRSRLNGWAAAAISVAVGWVLNFAWASVANESADIAARFGWACPTVLVAITWLVLPVSPRCDGDLTDRPHPRWSKVWIARPASANEVWNLV